MKIAVAGVGYVGLSLAVLLAQHNEVVAVTTTQAKADMINNGRSPIEDKEIEYYLKNVKLNLLATTDKELAYKDAGLVVVATPTNYSEDSGWFDTTAVEDVIERVLAVNPEAIIVIKSTIPVGYTESVRKKYSCSNIMFSPEFLRESKALYDNLYPSRIIVGTDMNSEKLRGAAETFAAMLCEGAEKENIETLFMGFTEAEAVKLFANTFLAVRVSYFNELDTYAEMMGLDSEKIIKGVCLDPRIGTYYNNPSFGYGGYCLPKDTKQLLSNYEGVPQNMISAVVSANDTRKHYIAEHVYELAIKHAGDKKPVVGIYRLTMKFGSDNFRQSAIQSIIAMLEEKNVEVLIYEPMYRESSHLVTAAITSDIEAFKAKSDIIIANRMDDSLLDAVDKVYTRDIFNRD